MPFYDSTSPNSPYYHPALSFPTPTLFPMKVWRSTDWASDEALIGLLTKY